jgi:hypothetical protein
MNEKEKAEELYSKFTIVIDVAFWANSSISNTAQSEIAKEAASIAVDELILETKLIGEQLGYELPESNFTYWAKVKQEIEKL